MDRCFSCKGAIKKKVIRHVHQWGEKVFIFKNVQAEICSQCGEVYFEPETLEKMDEFVTNSPKPEEIAQVPVYSLLREGRCSSLSFLATSTYLPTHCGY